MLRQVLAPIHPDGWKFIAIAAVVALILFFVWLPAGWLALILTLWMVFFFRDPWRVTPPRPGLIVSPADGIVVSLGPPCRRRSSIWEPRPCRGSAFSSTCSTSMSRAPRSAAS